MISGGVHWSSIAFGNGVFVALAYDSLTPVETSSDGGVTWTPDVTMTAQPPTTWNAVAFGVVNTVSTFVAVGYNSGGQGAAWSTNNGSTWTDTAPFPLGIPTQNWTSIAFGNNTFVAIAGSTVTHSTDGNTWSPSIIIPSPFADRIGTSVTFANGIFIAVDGLDSVAKSTDGINWTVTTLPPSDKGTYGAMSVAYGSGVFVTLPAGSRQTATSPDGITWSLGGQMPGPDNWSAIAFGAGKFVAIASGGTAAATSP
jgi:hypothetical protein